MDDGTPTLEVGFAIDTGSSFESLVQLQNVMGSAEAKIVAEAANIERATSGMLNLGPATASIRSFGIESSKALQDVVVSKGKTEKAGENLIRQLNREADAFGKTRAEINSAKAETLALAATQQGNSELAQRIAAAEAALYEKQFAAARRMRLEAEALAEERSMAAQQAAAAAEVEAQAIRSAAFAYNMFEAAARRGAQAMREQQAVAAAAARDETAMAAAAERLRASVDPLYAAQQRFNREMAEARTLISTGAITLDDYAAKLRMEQRALDANSGALARHTTSAVGNRMAMQGASYQVQDFFTQISMGANPINAFAVQGAQLAGQFSSIEGRAGSVARFFMGPWGLAITAALLVFGPLVGKLMDGNDALDDAVDKLKKDAQETDNDRRAKETFATSVEGVRKAILDQKDALDESAKALFSAAERANIAAKNNLEHEVSIRSVTKAMLDQAIVQAQLLRQEEKRAQGRNRTVGSLAGREGADLLGGAAGLTEERIAQLRALLGTQDALITTAERNLNRTRVTLAVETGKQMSTQVGRVTRQYDQQLAALQRAADAQAKAGKTIDASLTRQITALETLKQAAIDAANAQDRLNKSSADTATAASVAAMLRKTMPGVQITSTTGGKHTDGSDHYKNRAVDFVPAGGMSSMSKADVRAMVEKMGLQIRRNAGGVEQLFGPGDKGHSDHFHIAWEKGKDALDNYRASLQAGRAEQTALTRELTDAQITEAQTKNLYALSKAYGESGGAALVAEARIKAESDAIRAKGDVEASVARDVGRAIAQRIADAAQSTAAMGDQAAAQAAVNASVAAGLVPAERASELVQAQMADLPLLAAIQAANLTTNVEGAARATKALEDQRAARKRLTDEERNAAYNSAMATGADRLAELREELRLVGATDEVRNRALVTIRATREAERAFTDPAQRAAYVAQQLQIADATNQVASAQNALNASLSRTSELLDLIDQQASLVGDQLSTAFGGVGEGVATALSALTTYAATQAKIDQEHRAAVRAAGNDAAQLATAEVVYAKRSGIAKQQATMQAIGGIKSLFKEHSAAYKVMAGIEKAYAAWQAVETTLSIARDVAKTASHLVNSGTRTAANTAEGGSKIFAELGPWAFPVVAAMVAVLAALGARGGGGGTSGPAMPTSEDLQAKQGTGSVLGDSKAKSESITRSLEIVASNTNRDLEYSNGMLKALRSIELGISKMAGTIARQISVSGSLFDTSKLGLGSSGSSGFLGIGASSTTKSLQDLGLNLSSGSVADIIANGIAGQTYQVIEKIKKKSGFFGIGGGTKTSYSTVTGAIDPAITAAIKDVIGSLRSGVLSAADVIGLQGAQAILDSFQISLGKISLAGLSGKEIEEQLNAIFSKVGDDMAGAVFPELKQLQLVGEGLFETFSRVAREYQVVDVALTSIGKAFGAVGVSSVAARDELVQLFGGLDGFVEATSAFRDAFLTDAERIAPVAAAVRTEMARLGMAGITTRDQFKQAVLGLDLTTEAGRSMYASLLAVAPAFDKVLSYLDQANKATADGLKSTADQFGSFVTSLTKYRESLFAADTAQGDAYQVLRARFNATATLAATGDATALGGLEASGKAFLDAARNNASTREEYLRDVALVARGVEAGIFAADATADYAKLQLDALTNAVSILTAIGASTAATASALGTGTSPIGSAQLDQIRAQAEAAGTVTAAGASSAATASGADSSSNEDLRLAIVSMGDEIAQLRADNNAGHAATAGNTGRMARKLDDVTAASGGDAIAMVVPA